MYANHGRIDKYNHLTEGINSRFDSYYTGIAGHLIAFLVGYAAALVFNRRDKDLTNLTVWTEAEATVQPET